MSRDEIDAGAVALFEMMADELDCWDEDPLEDGRRWREMSKAVLAARENTGAVLAKYETEYRTDWSSRT